MTVNVLQQPSFFQFLAAIDYWRSGKHCSKLFENDPHQLGLPTRLLSGEQL